MNPLCWLWGGHDWRYFVKRWDGGQSTNFDIDQCCVCGKTRHNDSFEVFMRKLYATGEATPPGPAKTGDET